MTVVGLVVVVQVNVPFIVSGVVPFIVLLVMVKADGAP